MAGAAGALLSIIFPISPLNGPLFLGKAFVVCVLGGLGSVPGAMVGGLVLGVIESFGVVLARPGARGDAVVRAAAGAAVRAPERPAWAGGATNEELDRAGSLSRLLLARAAAACRQQLFPAARDHRLHVRGDGAVVEFHRRACGLSVVRHRGVLRASAPTRRRSCRSTARRWCSPGAAPASRRWRSRPCSAARSCTCAGIISRSRA